MARPLGLREKSVLALSGTSLLVLLLAGMAGWQAVESMRSYLGIGYTSNFTLLNRERILAPLARDLALSFRLAGSQTLRQWLLDESNPEKKALAFREAEGFRGDFTDHSYFLASAATGNYYFNDAHSPLSSAPRYRLDPGNSNDAWFFNTMRGDQRFNINVDPGVKLGVTKVWFNVAVMEGERKLALVGGALDLSTFLRDFIATGEPGVTPMIVNAEGAIQAHPNPGLIAFNSGTGKAGVDRSLFALLGKDDAAPARAALAAAAAQPGTAHTFPARLQGKQQLVAVSYISELKWHVLTAVDLDAVQVIRDDLLWKASLAAAALLALAAFGFVYAVDRMALNPLLKLTHSAREMAAGNYAVELPAARNDEIGELTAAFGAMAEKVRRHTEELEETVRERTRKLVQANQQMAQAHKKINDSISYASMIQRAILPDRQLDSALGPNHFVLWRPRDVVGGDFYVYRETADGCLLGVVDCAGHGVPGAFMTMLARSAIDQAIDEAGLRDPARILARTDQAIRAMLHADGVPPDIATNMDAGFVYLDFAAGQAIFAGARVALYWCDGAEVGSLRGGRRALGDRHPGEFANENLALRPERTFYMTTDGFLDQSGGERGYGFGSARFAAMLREHARLPLAGQSAAFASTLAAYQGEYPQRDDITILSFRFS